MGKEQELFIRSDKALLSIVEQIAGNQWDEKVSGPLAGGKDLTLRELINYHAYDDIWVPETLAGKTIAEVGDKYAGDLLGPDPVAAFASVVDAATSAVAALTKDDLNVPVHLSYGDYATREYLLHISTFRGFRSYTIAHFIGADSTMDPKLVQCLWDEVVPQVETWRQMGVFGPAIAVPADADLQTRLLGTTGFLQI